jgi:hypothetical protein
LKAPTRVPSLITKDRTHTLLAARQYTYSNPYGLVITLHGKDTSASKAREGTWGQGDKVTRGCVAAVRRCIEVGSGLRTDLGVVRRLGWHAVPTLPEARAIPIRFKWTYVSRRTDATQSRPYLGQHNRDPDFIEATRSARSADPTSRQCQPYPRQFEKGDRGPVSEHRGSTTLDPQPTHSIQDCGGLGTGIGWGNANCCLDGGLFGRADGLGGGFAAGFG